MITAVRSDAGLQPGTREYGEWLDEVRRTYEPFTDFVSHEFIREYNRKLAYHDAVIQRNQEKARQREKQLQRQLLRQQALERKQQAREQAREDVFMDAATRHLSASTLLIEAIHDLAPKHWISSNVNKTIDYVAVLAQKHILRKRESERTGLVGRIFNRFGNTEFNERKIQRDMQDFLPAIQASNAMTPQTLTKVLKEWSLLYSPNFHEPNPSWEVSIARQIGIQQVLSDVLRELDSAHPALRPSVQRRMGKAVRAAWLKQGNRLDRLEAILQQEASRYHQQYLHKYARPSLISRFFGGRVIHQTRPDGA